MAWGKMSTDVSFRTSVSLLSAYLTPQWFKVSLLAFLLFGSLGLEILGPQLLGQFIDSLQRNIQVLASLALLFIGLVIANQLITALASYMSEDISWRATSQIPPPEGRGLGSKLHRNSAYRERRAALISSLDPSGVIDKDHVLVQSCRASNVRIVRLRAPIRSAWRV